jgi:hypothetical protein
MFGHKARFSEKSQRLRAVRAAVEDHMKRLGMEPRQIRGRSLRYWVGYAGNRETWALKVATKEPGPMGFVQKKGAVWSSPLGDTDRILYATVDDAEHPTEIVCYLFRTEYLCSRYDTIQAHYIASGRKGTAALWGHIYDRPASGGWKPVQVGLASGQSPLWTLPYVPVMYTNRKSARRPKSHQDPRLSKATIEQMQAELCKRGMRIDGISSR